MSHPKRTKFAIASVKLRNLAIGAATAVMATGLWSAAHATYVLNFSGFNPAKIEFVGNYYNGGFGSLGC